MTGAIYRPIGTGAINPSVNLIAISGSRSISPYRFWNHIIYRNWLQVSNQRLDGDAESFWQGGGRWNSFVDTIVAIDIRFRLIEWPWPISPLCVFNYERCDRYLRDPVSFFHRRVDDKDRVVAMAIYCDLSTQLEGAVPARNANGRWRRCQ